MATQISTDPTLRFQIDSQAGEAARACTAIARSVIPQTRGNLLVFGIYIAIGLASYFLTPTTALTTFVIGLAAVLGTLSGLQAVGRANLRRLQLADPHSAETHFVELSTVGVHAWCAHIDARYPWTDFAKVVENNEFYMLVRPSGTGTAIPKRLLSDADDAHLRDCLRDWSPDQGVNLAKERPA